jgi:hypothetical protein
MLPQVVLMILLGRIKSFEFLETRHHRVVIQLGLVNLFNDRLCRMEFVVILVKNSRSIGRADIIPLSIARSRVVNSEEKIKESFKGGFCRIIRYGESLSMARVGVIGRIGILTARISNLSVSNTWLLSKELFESPEAATCEIRCFHPHTILPELQFRQVQSNRLQCHFVWTMDHPYGPLRFIRYCLIDRQLDVSNSYELGK